MNTNHKELEIIVAKYTAIYPRVSSEKQISNTSLGYQEEECRKRAKSLGIPDELIKIYREEGASGEDIDRPQMNELRDDIKNGLIERLIIVHPDRLSRNMVDRLIVCAEFDKYEVELIFLDVEYKDTEEGKLFFNIQSSIAQYELALIKKRTRRGSIKSAQSGEIMGMRLAPYGYDYADKHLTINKEESKFVKQIYQWYVYDKLTMREIGERLCSQGAIPKRMKEGIEKGKINKDVPPVWSTSSLQRILTSETYIGKYYYNRRSTKKIKGEKTKSGKPKRVYDYREKEDWIEIPVPQIIDFATFSLAQDQREKNTKHSGNIKHEYLLRQKIRCGCCGNKFSSYTTESKTRSKKTGEVTSFHSYRNYRCTNKMNRRFGEGVEQCPSKIIRADYLEDYLWEELILPIVYMPETIINSVKNKNEKPSQDVEDTYNLLKFKMEKLVEEKKRIVQLFKKSYIDEDEMEKDMKKIDSGIKDLKGELGKYEQQIFNMGKNKLNLEMLKLQIEDVRKKMDNEKELSFKAKRQIVNLFIDEIILKWEEDELILTTVGWIDTFTNEKRLLELTSQHQININSTNIVFNLTFETLFLVNRSARGVEYEVKEHQLNIN